MGNTAFEETGINKKWLFIILLGTLALAIGATVLIVTSSGKRSSQTRVTTPSTSPEAYQPKPAETIDWQEVQAIPEPRLGLMPPLSCANLPVQGELNVNIDPADISKLPESINVYEFVPFISSEEDFRAIADRFGMRGDLEAPMISIQDGNKLLYYTIGEDSITYRDTGLEKDPMTPPTVPSDAECQKIAWKLAEKYGLLVPGAEIIEAGGSTGGLAGDKAYIIKRSLVIGRSLDGYRVRGPGMQIFISIGDRGRLVYLSNNLRDLKLYGTYRLKPLEQALDEAKRGAGTMNLQAESVNPTVTKLEIVYYAETAEREQRLLQPVYAFMGDDCCIYVPAFGERIE